MKNILTFAPIIKFIQSSWFGLSLAVCLQIINLDTSNAFNKSSIALCMLTVIMFAVAASFFFYKINYCQSEEKFALKYGSLFVFYKLDSFWARNFAFWIFLKKSLFMMALTVLYNHFEASLIFMCLVSLIFGLLILFIQPYTLPRMNTFHTISEILLVLSFGIVYLIELCNIQINNSNFQGINENLVQKKVNRFIFY